MKLLVAALAMIAATAQPVLADTCWVSADGNRVLFPTDSRVAVTYAHDGMVEPCNAEAVSADKWRVWCDVTSRNGMAYAGWSPGGGRTLIWDDQAFVRDPHCYQ